jgi:xanthine dehydrogenase accessory factor
MKELELIVAEIEKLRASGRSAVLATVVDVEGSAYRLPGARMLISDAGWSGGSVSGGCLEGDVVLRAAEIIKNNEAAVVTYDTTSDEDIIFGVGLGCRGIIRVLIEPVLSQAKDPDLVRFIKNCLDHRETGIVATIISVEGRIAAGPGSRLVLRADGGSMANIADDALRSAVAARVAGMERADMPVLVAITVPEGLAEVFVELIEPPLPLIIFGAGHDAIPMVRQAKALGWDVTVVDHRPAYATAARFPTADQVILCSPEEMPARVHLGSETYALIMTHNYLRDLKLLERLLPSPVRYVGLLGPRRRTEQLLAELDQQRVRVTPEQLERFYAPVGLDIGAEGPEGVALAVFSEMQAVIANRSGGHLRDRAASIHSPEPAEARTGRLCSSRRVRSA